MERRKKHSNIERKRRDIFRDYCKMFQVNKPVDDIYKALEKKYYIDQGTIYRVILEKKGIVKEDKQHRGDDP